MARPHDLETVSDPAPGEEMDEMRASLTAAVEENPDPRAGEREQDDDPPEPREKPAAKPEAAKPAKSEGLEDEDEPAPTSVEKPAKPAAKPAAKPTADETPDPKKTGKTEEEELTVEQIRALRIGRGASKNDVVGFQKLRGIAEKATETAASLRKEVEALKGNSDTAPALATENAQLKAKVDELQKFEYLVNPEASHIVRAKYDPQITQTEDQILHYLREGGMKEATLELIKSEGRLKKFSKDQWLGAEEWDKLKPFAKKKAQDAVMKYFDLQDERKAEIEKAATDRTAYEGTIKEKAEAQVKKNIEEFEDEVAKMLPDLPGWARIVPEDDLKGEELAKAKAHNKYLSEVLEPMFQKAANPQSVREVTRNAGKIVELHQLKIEHEELKKEKERLEAENEALTTKINQRKTLARIPGGPTAGVPKKPGNLGSSGAPAGDEDDMKANMDVTMGRRSE